MEQAKKESSKYSKKFEKKTTDQPIWFNQDISKEEITEEEQEELKDLLKDFR